MFVLGGANPLCLLDTPDHGAILKVEVQGDYQQGRPVVFYADPEWLSSKGLTVEEAIVVPNELGRAQVMVSTGTEKFVKAASGSVIGTVEPCELVEGFPVGCHSRIARRSNSHPSLIRNKCVWYLLARMRSRGDEERFRQEKSALFKPIPVCGPFHRVGVDVLTLPQT